MTIHVLHDRKRVRAQYSLLAAMLVFLLLCVMAWTISRLIDSDQTRIARYRRQGLSLHVDDDTRMVQHVDVTSEWIGGPYLPVQWSLGQQELKSISWDADIKLDGYSWSRLQRIPKLRAICVQQPTQFNHSFAAVLPQCKGLELLILSGRGINVQLDDDWTQAWSTCGSLEFFDVAEAITAECSGSAATKLLSP